MELDHHLFVDVEFIFRDKLLYEKNDEWIKEIGQMMNDFPGSPIFTVLHLSDIHVDFPYTPESQGDCPQPLFCRCDQQTSGHTGAGFCPGCRVYKTDGHYPESSYWVLDHRAVIMNLTTTNMYKRRIFIDEYKG
ncbi:unnamed protein product [Rotaria sp. Silwood2]|nr:unnamed protein product [Rotaria sp. Silwood2]